MITQVQMISVDLPSTSQTFIFGDETASYIIKNIDGLGPVDADIKLTTYSDMPGASFQAAHVGTRNIVMTIGLNANYATSDPIGTLRRALHPLLMPSRFVDMIFTRDVGPVVHVSGYVEKFEPNIFSDEPQVVVSIICPDPYFSAMTPTTGSRSGNGDITFWNNGDVASGLVITVDGFISSHGNGILFTHGWNEKYDYMNYSGAPYYDAEVLVFDTIRGQKSARYMGWYEYHDVNADNSSPYTGPKYGWINVLGYVDAWIQIQPGYNVLNTNIIDIADMTTPPTVTTTFVDKYAGL